MIAMIISAVVAAVQGIGGPSEERTADIECVYEYRTSDDKGREDAFHNPSGREAVGEVR